MPDQRSCWHRLETISLVLQQASSSTAASSASGLPFCRVVQPRNAEKRAPRRLAEPATPTALLDVEVQPGLLVDDLHNIYCIPRVCQSPASGGDTAEVARRSNMEHFLARGAAAAWWGKRGATGGCTLWEIGELAHLTDDPIRDAESGEQGQGI